MAGKNIKGITVEIGGDTTELTAELKKLDNSAKSSSAELKEINAALKSGNPQNVTMLAQKHDALTRSIAAAKDKVDLLRKAEEQAAEQVKNGELGEEQYRALQREVVFAENKLKKLEKELEDCEKAQEGAADAAKDTGKEIANAADKAEDAAKRQGDLEVSLEGLKGKYDDAKGAAKDAAKEFAASVTAITGAVTGTAVVAMSYEDALSLLQTQTGASAYEMTRYEKVLEDVFASGLGEDIDDVAASMAKIVRQTKETDPDALRNLTENALVLRQTFDFEIDEQLRAVKALTTQFGLSADEAYNLIVQGAQAGLNQNGDLLDVINEYSVHYSQLGYSAEDFFNSLVSGAETGVFSVDKLGDAVKEFGVRIKDTGSTTTDALTSLGFVSQAELSALYEERAALEETLAGTNDEKKRAEIEKEINATTTLISEAESKLTDGLGSVEDLQAAFAAGGETAQDAMSVVLGALWDTDDQVKQNELGVALFGTMWEDLGAKAIRELGDVGGKLSVTKSAMESVKDVNLSSTSNQWRSLGRSVQTELIIPLGEKLLPLARKIVSSLSGNAGTLTKKLKQIATIIASMWVASKVGAMVSAISKAVVAYKQLKAATTAANAAMATTPWGAVGAAVGLAVGAIVSFFSAENDAAEAAKQLREELDAQTKSYWETANAASEAASVRRSTLKGIGEEHDGYEDLWNELSLLVDENGNVLEGNEERVRYIKTVLSEALGIEIDLIDGQIEKYGELQESIFGTIMTSRITHSMEAMQGDYDEAVENLDSYQLEYERTNRAWLDYKNLAYEVAEKREERQALVDRRAYLENNEPTASEGEELSGSDWYLWQEEIDEINGQISEIDTWLHENPVEYHNEKENAEAARYTYDQALATIYAYEGLEDAYYSEDEAAQREALDFAEEGMMTYATGAGISSLERQAIETIIRNAELRDMAGNPNSSVTQEQLDDAAETMATAIIILREAAGREYSLEDLTEDIGDYLNTADLTDSENEYIAGFSGSAENLIEKAGVEFVKMGNRIMERASDALSFQKSTGRDGSVPVARIEPAIAPTLSAIAAPTEMLCAEIGDILADYSGDFDSDFNSGFSNMIELLTEISRQIDGFELEASLDGVGLSTAIDNAIGRIVVGRKRGSVGR